MLQKLAAILASALIDAAIAWIKNPDNADDVKAAGNFIADRVAASIPAAVDQVTNLIPGTWDDKLIDPLANKIVGAITGQLDRVVGEALKSIPIIGGGLGGLFGGKGHL